MPDQFVSIDYLISFPGMIAVVVLLTQFTKKLFDSLLPNQTKYVAYGWTLLLTIVVASMIGDWVNPVSTAVVWLINSCIIWFSSMKTFEIIKGE
jgi:hypothetical protein